MAHLRNFLDSLKAYHRDDFTVKTRDFAIQFQPKWARHLTTKITKDTNVSEIDISKLLNFVIFVSFVVKFAFSSLVAAMPRWDLRGQNVAFSSALVSVATIVSKAI
jgi:hypothetical protein